ncbi:MAG: hypothetical protein AAGI07_12940 [Bacteroidota bacterium]
MLLEFEIIWFTLLIFITSLNLLAQANYITLSGRLFLFLLPVKNFFKSSSILVIVFFVLTSCSFSTSNNKSTISSTNSKHDSLLAAQQEANKSTKSDEEANWQNYQDSLRNTLLNSKPNKLLKTSILQEVYIRGLLQDLNGVLQFTLPFNLHSFDCSAPDCYSTEISFHFRMDDELLFPKELPFTINEYGCVDEETNITSTFLLTELEDNYINYYSPSERSNLIIFKTDKQKSFVYYFVEVEQGSITGNDVNRLLNEYEEDPEANAPYRITTMCILDYKIFLDE